MTVYVNDEAMEVLPGMTVKHALVSQSPESSRSAQDKLRVRGSVRESRGWVGYNS
jgi:sulfur carrier protein ThiS